MAIAFHAQAASTADSANITIGAGSDLVALVGVYTYGSATPTVSVTIDGVSMTAIPGGQRSGTTGDGAAVHTTFILYGPAVGTVVVACTASHDIVGWSCLVYSGCAQSGQPNAVATGDSAGTGFNSTTITPTVADTWAVTMANGYNNGSNPTAGTNVTGRASDGNAVMAGDSNGTITNGVGYAMRVNGGGFIVMQVIVTLIAAGGGAASLALRSAGRLRGLPRGLLVR